VLTPRPAPGSAAPSGHRGRAARRHRRVPRGAAAAARGRWRHRWRPVTPPRADARRRRRHGLRRPVTARRGPPSGGRAAARRRSDDAAARGACELRAQARAARAARPPLGLVAGSVGLRARPPCARPAPLRAPGPPACARPPSSPRPPPWGGRPWGAEVLGPACACAPQGLPPSLTAARRPRVGRRVVRRHGRGGGHGARPAVWGAPGAAAAACPRASRRCRDGRRRGAAAVRLAGGGAIVGPIRDEGRACACRPRERVLRSRQQRRRPGAPAAHARLEARGGHGCSGRFGAVQAHSNAEVAGSGWGRGWGRAPAGKQDFGVPGARWCGGRGARAPASGAVSRGLERRGARGRQARQGGDCAAGPPGRSGRRRWALAWLRSGAPRVIGPGAAPPLPAPWPRPPWGAVQGGARPWGRAQGTGPAAGRQAGPGFRVGVELPRECGAGCWRQGDGSIGARGVLREAAARGVWQKASAESPAARPPSARAASCARGGPAAEGPLGAGRGGPTQWPRRGGPATRLLTRTVRSRSGPGGGFNARWRGGGGRRGWADWVEKAVAPEAAGAKGVGRRADLRVQSARARLMQEGVGGAGGQCKAAAVLRGARRGGGARQCVSTGKRFGRGGCLTPWTRLGKEELIERWAPAGKTEWQDGPEGAQGAGPAPHDRAGGPAARGGAFSARAEAREGRASSAWTAGRPRQSARPGGRPH
jgi:hypothetical protein